MKINTIAISTGGGDCPGLNAVIRAAVKSAVLQHDWKVIGSQDGFDGLIWPEKSRPLELADVSGILPRGGTILGTTNRGNPFRYVSTEDGKEVTRDLSDQVIANVRKMGIDALIVIGGDGTQKIALDLQRKGLNVVGVPKTIDNDLSATEITFGFDTALHTATEAIDKLHTTAESHHRIMVVEVMGRDTGWIALEAGIAGGAHVILIPEIPFDYEKISDVIKAREAAGHLGTVVIVAEGARPKYGEQVKRDVEGSEFRLGGIGEIVAREIAQQTGKETRCCVLGHLQRGGAPTTLDRILATRFGVKAVQLANEGHFGSMVSYQNYQVRHVSIAEAVNRLKLVPPNGELVQTARDVDISFGD